VGIGFGIGYLTKGFLNKPKEEEKEKIL